MIHTKRMFGLTEREIALLGHLSTPGKVQDFLDTLPRNYEKQGDTLLSPRRVMRERKAHCIEGALLAGLAFWVHGRQPLLLDLKPTPEDDGHVVALFKEHGYWGAVSKTNHASLGFRDPIYKTVRELALSYFHEYFLNSNGKKTLRSYGGPFNLKRLGKKWITAEEDLLWLNDTLDAIPHISLIPKKNSNLLRPASPLEQKAGRLTQWKRGDRGT